MFIVLMSRLSLARAGGCPGDNRPARGVRNTFWCFASIGIFLLQLVAPKNPEKDLRGWVYTQTSRVCDRDDPPVLGVALNLREVKVLENVHNKSIKKITSTM